MSNTQEKINKTKQEMDLRIKNRLDEMRKTIYANPIKEEENPKEDE